MQVIRKDLGSRPLDNSFIGEVWSTRYIMEVYLAGYREYTFLAKT